MNRFREWILILAAAAVFLGGIVVGSFLLLSPAPEPPARPICENRTLQAGEDLTPNLLMVNVFNAGKQAGLANRVRIQLERKGFLGGVTGNYSGSAKVARVTILTSAQDDPKVRLLAKQFKDKVEYAPADIDVETGLIVVVGPKFGGLKKKSSSAAKLKAPVTVCVPTLDLG